MKNMQLGNEVKVGTLMPVRNYQKLKLCYKFRGFAFETPLGPAIKPEIGDSPRKVYCYCSQQPLITVTNAISP